MSLKVKICGMRKAENVKEVSSLRPDLMGFIFYKSSPRYVEESSLREVLEDVPNEISKVAVFVNEAIDEVTRICISHGFDYAQLHGDESKDYCKELREAGVAVIKAFSVGSSLDFDEIRLYAPYVDFFLFDTKTKGYGGSGKQFDRSLLHEYPLETPYFLSGGIGESDSETILQEPLPKCIGIDANSRLETRPGLKNTQAVSRLINQIRKG